MVARAEATAALRERIVDSTERLFEELASDRFSLEDVAAGAGTTVQTVLRHFGSKDQLLRATMDRGMDRVREERMQAPVGDVPGAVRNLVEHYEDRGDMVLRWLAEEDRNPFMHEILDRGREFHHEWVGADFAPQLRAGRPAPPSAAGWRSWWRSPTSMSGSCCAATCGCLAADRGGNHRTDRSTGGDLMARVLAYTSPARGHLYPLVPILDELAGRGHEIAIRTLASQVPLMRDRGFAAAPISSARRGPGPRRLPGAHAAGKPQARRGQVRRARRVRGSRSPCGDRRRAPRRALGRRDELGRVGGRCGVGRPVGAVVPLSAARALA